MLFAGSACSLRLAGGITAGMGFTILHCWAFRYRSERTGRWVRASYKTDKATIAARHAEWEVEGPPEVRMVPWGGVQMATSSSMVAGWRPPDYEAPRPKRPGRWPVVGIAT